MLAIQNFLLPPSNELADKNWPIFNGTGTSQTSDDVNIIFANDLHPYEYGMLLNHVNSKYYDVNQLNSLKIDVPSSFWAVSCEYCISELTCR